ncbi:hypothetical protein [Alteromonas lipolytica]|uniref:hypothetical protein n=1 Tax=Alteromonas lipolytica TaxID=1856405 RepID=UPI001113119F|nr:hypothetical protein [Alteromonas lipolytica]GGF69335.1 hypothetical protein GCM10011338_21880 [Alteromonas lipolytica]
MQVQQQEIEAVEAKLNRQNGLAAAIAAALWAVPMLILWYWLYLQDDRFAPLMLAVSGALIGLTVRYYGRGFMPVFGVIAVISHTAVVAAAFVFGLSLGEGQSVRAFILVGLYAIGVWSAVYLGRRRIPFAQHRAFYLLCEQSRHVSTQRLRNRWFLLVPVTVILSGLTLGGTLFALTGVEIFRQTASQQSQVVEQRQAFAAKAIDVTSANLATLSTEDAMRFAFAYYHGQLPAKKGNRYERYPQSEYKAKRILSFLAEQRGEARAKFVLGWLTYPEGGATLIKQAADDGDIFAKIMLATEFGCYGNTEQATRLLNMLAKTTAEKPALNEIYSILQSGFEQVCEEFSAPDFAQMYLP